MVTGPIYIYFHTLFCKVHPSIKKNCIDTSVNKLAAIVMVQIMLGESATTL